MSTPHGGSQSGDGVRGWGETKKTGNSSGREVFVGLTRRVVHGETHKWRLKLHLDGWAQCIGGTMPRWRRRRIVKRRAFPCKQ